MTITPGQVWVPNSGSVSTSHTTTGPATSAGSLLVLTSMCRDNTSTVPVVSDTAGNTWQHAGTFRDPAQSTLQHLFYATDTAPITAVTQVVYAADGSSPPTATHTSTLQEFVGAGGFLLAATSASANVPTGGAANGATVTAPDAGVLVVASATSGVTNRTLTPGADWAEVLPLASMAQMRNWRSWHVTTAAGAVTPPWTLTAGSPTSFGHITAVFSPKASDPDPGPATMLRRVNADRTLTPVTLAMVTADGLVHL